MARPLSLIIALLASSTLWTQGRLITLTVPNVDATNGVAEFQLESYEAAELVSFPSDIASGSRIDIIKNGFQFHYSANPFAFPSSGPTLPKPPLEPLIVAGPARILLRSDTGRPSLCTFRVTPESYPPDKSLLIAPGPGGAEVTLEFSTNLVNWIATTNGIYTNVPVATFFRIKEQRIRGE